MPLQISATENLRFGLWVISFVYEKFDDHNAQTGRLDIKHTIYVEKGRTADYQMTRGIREILDRDGNKDDLVAFFADRNLPVEEIEAGRIADAILQDRPKQGYLTISNALQWRLQYTRVIQKAGVINGILRVSRWQTARRQKLGGLAIFKPLRHLHAKQSTICEG